VDIYPLVVRVENREDRGREQNPTHGISWGRRGHRAWQASRWERVGSETKVIKGFRITIDTTFE
jgi:hypothetical protein